MTPPILPSLPPAPHRVPHWFALSYLGALVVVSLYPFTEWEFNGQPWLDFLLYPLPYYRTAFDQGVNVLAYVPYGVALARMFRPAWLGVLAALGLGALTSLVIEIIQLYVGQKESPVMRPVRELKGFCKLRLAPGEEKEAEFILDSRSFSYYEERIHDWYANSGEYRIEIGASSRDIRLSAGIRYQADKELPVHFTKYSTIGELLQTEKGRAYMKVLKTRMGGDPAPAEGEIKEDEEESNGGEESTNALGEGADRADAAALGMPLYSFHTFGFMSEEEVEALVA